MTVQKIVGKGKKDEEINDQTAFGSGCDGNVDITFVGLQRQEHRRRGHHHRLYVEFCTV